LSTEAKKRVLSGMRPTGRLHIGHYFGALQNWVKLQNDGAHDCFYFVADWHALTSDYADTSAVAENSMQIAIDYLAAGLDPAKSVIFQQSFVPEHAELHLLLSMVTPLGWLERVPTYKEQLENIQNKDLHTYGFLGYPTLQTADIVIYSKPGGPLFVPVGEDQVSHVEFSRELVRKFNSYYGLQISPAVFHVRKGDELPLIVVILTEIKGIAGISHPHNWSEAGQQPLRGQLEQAIREHIREVGFSNFIQTLPTAHQGYFFFRPPLVEPSVLLTQTPRVPGLDGRKMSKSYGNAITLSESDEEIRKKTKVMVTDPARKRRTDVGDPDVCPVYDWHKLFSPKETLEWAAQGCRTAGIGCIECKAKMADHLIQWIEPVRRKRIEYEQHPKRVLEILDEGSKRARGVAQETMGRVREAIFGWEQKRKEIAAG
jgi:tryptophanyl-tRNA synthetase